MESGNKSQSAASEAAGLCSDGEGPDLPMVVGIGASAGGLEALSRFFAALPDRNDMAFVVIVHLSPEHESNMAGLLQQHTQMSVTQVTECVRIEANHVYVIPPNRSLSIEDGHLVLSEFEEPRGKRVPIDFFFRSFAAAHADGVGMLFSGSGTDGTVGLKAVKEQGGLVMVQDPIEAQYDGMLRSAIATGIVDFVLPAEELARQLAAYRENKHRLRLPEQPEALKDSDAEALQKIFTQLRTRTGHDFSSYKRSTVLRRIGRRMQLNQTEDLSDYLQLLRQDAGEAQALLKNLLISVTNFFRDPEAWEALEEKVVPQLFEHAAPERQVRVWTPGCATGEEAYSIAILLLEHAAPRPHAPEVQVFASDIDQDALAYAREGLYPQAIAADVSEERLRRFFTEERDHYRVKKEVRERVLFAAHSLLKDPPFSRLDLITCRNLLIYLNRDLQLDVFKLLHYVLRTGGYLFLGSAESADGTGEFFRVIDKKHRIYKRREVPQAHLHLPSMPLADAATVLAVPRAEEQALPKGLPEVELHRKMLETYAPPSVVVGRNYDLVHLSETAGRYLIRPAGRPTTNILQEVRPELRLELQTALYQAFEHGQSTTTRPLRVQFNGAVGFVHLIVQPGRGRQGVQDFALVVFAEVEVSREQEGTEVSPTIVQLEGELQRTKERLQAVMEEYESSREEMKAANEELQSINEEYKSTLEELETSQEELQSVNEELGTVNQELKNKVEELSQANSDLQNLIASTDVGTLFLDRSLRIQWYTPRIAELFNVMPGDRGRPIMHLTPRVEYDALVDDAGRVLRELATVEREVRSKEDRWFLVRLKPYRTVEEKIDGVVITFVDITARKRAEERLLAFTETLEQRVKERTQQVHRLASSLTLAEQRERRRIAEVLHDHLQQLLYGMQMQVKLLGNVISAGKDAGEHFEQVNQLLDDAIHVTRTLAVDLSPPTLKEEGLKEALAWLCLQMRELHGLHVALSARGDIAVQSEDIRVFLFQLVRELLFNVVKHAGVERAEVEVFEKDDLLCIMVKDEGRGFDKAVLKKPREIGFGLSNMRERIELFGGELKMAAAPGKGVQVTVAIPKDAGRSQAPA